MYMNSKEREKFSGVPLKDEVWKLQGCAIHELPNKTDIASDECVQTAPPGAITLQPPPPPLTSQRRADSNVMFWKDHVYTRL